MIIIQILSQGEIAFKKFSFNSDTFNLCSLLYHSCVLISNPKAVYVIFKEYSLCSNKVVIFIMMVNIIYQIDEALVP